MNDPGSDYHPMTLAGVCVEVGYITSWIFSALFFVIIFLPGVIHPGHKWIGLIYLFCQLAEVLARDPLSNAEVFQDHAYSIIPGIIGLILFVLEWVRVLPQTVQGEEILLFWTVIAWFDFFFGIFINQRMLTIKYERSEREPH